MYNFIFILGAQGAGKTTLARILKQKLNSTHIDFDWIRGFHLNATWSNTSVSEETMSLENLSLLLKNYVKHGYQNVIVSGLSKENISLLDALKDYRSILFTLYLTDDQILKERVLNETRDSGFRDFEASIASNKILRNETPSEIENKIDNTNQTPEETAQQIVEILHAK